MIVSEEAKDRKRKKQQDFNRDNPEYIKQWRRDNIIKCILQVVRARAKRRGLLCNLTEEDIILPEVCPVLGITLVSHISDGLKRQEDSYSVDRIDNSQGYIKGNIQIISNKANVMKHNATKEELIKFANWILKDQS